MIFFYYLLLGFLLYLFYTYNKNFKKLINLKTYIFKNILKYLKYNVEEFDINLLPSRLIIISSHTSIYDFIIGTIFYYGYLYSKYDNYVLMKDEFQTFCKPFLNIFCKKFKLISISSSKYKNGITDKICKELSDKNNYILCIAPEGTRRCTDTVKSGYWYISKNLNIDIIYIGIDFSKKNIFLEKYRKPMDLFEEDKNEFIKSCKKYIPLYPERCYWTKDFYIDSSSDE